MAKENTQMPMSSAGILSTSTDNVSNFQIPATYIVVLIIAVVLLVSLMHAL